MIYTRYKVALFATVSLAIAAPVKSDAAEPKVPEIVEVASSSALNAMDPTFKIDGWDVRIAMAPGTMPDKPLKAGAPPEFSGSPWRILYAEFRRTKPGAILPEHVDTVDGERLGPLEFELDFVPVEKARMRDLIKEIEMAKLLRGVADRYLFAALIPAMGKGGYEIRVYPPQPKLKKGFEREKPDPIATAKWKQMERIPVTWTRFANSRYLSLPDLGIPVPDEMVVPFIPFAPSLDGHMSLLGFADEKVDGGDPAGMPIPGMIPAESDPKFTIALSGAGISIRIVGPAYTNAHNFLARWWIGDKLVEMPFDDFERREEPDIMREAQKRFKKGEVFTTRIPFSLPEALEGTDPDSKVSVQLLYSPVGTMRLREPDEVGLEDMSHFDIETDCNFRLSNRLEFKLSDVTAGD